MRELGIPALSENLWGWGAQFRRNSPKVHVASDISSKPSATFDKMQVCIG